MKAGVEFGEDDATADAVEKAVAVDFLQRLDLTRERRLGEVQRPRGGREAALGGNRVKGSRIRRIHSCWLRNFV